MLSLVLFDGYLKMPGLVQFVQVVHLEMSVPRFDMDDQKLSMAHIVLLLNLKGEKMKVQDIELLVADHIHLRLLYQERLVVKFFQLP